MSTLYLFPVPIDEMAPAFFSEEHWNALRSCTYLLCENPKSARSVLRFFSEELPLQNFKYILFDKNTASDTLDILLKEDPTIQALAVLSESGCPGIADPGSTAVNWAHKNSWKVKPLIGPSSIVLSLMASGLNGQNFAFRGYLPVEAKSRRNAINKFEQMVIKEKQSQIFIETPYRNQSLLLSMLECLHPDTYLCVAQKLSAPDEWIYSAPISKWKKNVAVTLQKAPCIFIIGIP